MSHVSEESAFEEDEIELEKIGGRQYNVTSLISGEKGGNDVKNDCEIVKKKKPTIKILASMPRNAKEEEKRFFESGFTINP